MSKREHTPGPWKVEMSGRAAYVSIYRPLGLPRETGWANFAPQPYSHPAEAEANARLIAAAPDLLAALELIIDRAEWEAESLSELGRDDANTEEEAKAAWAEIATARAAIAKATGGQT